MKKRLRHPYRREQILRAAVELFHRSGVTHASMEAIAAAVGIRTPSIYHHFRDKGALLDAAIDRAQAELTARVERCTAEPDPARRLDLLVDSLVDHVIGDLPLAAVGRHDRPHASARTRRRAEKSDALLLDAVVDALTRIRPLEPKATHRTRANALVGAIWSVTHADLRLEPARLRVYLRTAGLAVLHGAAVSSAGRRRRSRRAVAGAPRVAASSRTRPR